MAGTGYDGFISYSHAADELLAPALQSALQRFAKPWYRRQSLRLFRDETALSANPHLWTSVVEAMDSSRFFVLLSSPDAAGSDWVGKEIDHWVEQNGTERILPVVTGGAWVWDPDAGDFDWERSTAVHPALRKVFWEEPRYVDMAWARSSLQLDHRDARFLDAVAEIAAPLRGVSKDELAGEEVRQHRRTMRTARSAVGTLATLLIVAIVAAAIAIAQQNRADDAVGTARAQATEALHQADVANAGRLSTLAVSLVDKEPQQALLLAAEGYRLHDDVTTFRTLLTVLTSVAPHRASRRTVQQVPPDLAASLTSGDISPDLELAVLGTSDGVLHFFDVPQGTELTSVRLRAEPRAVVFSPDSTLVATSEADGLISFWDPRSGHRVGPQIQDGASSSFGVLGALALSKDHGVLAAADSDRSLVRFFSTVSGLELAPPIDLAEPVDLEFRADGRALIAAGPDRVVVIDANSMTVTHQFPTTVEDRFTAVALSSDGRWAFGGDASGRLHAWDLANSGDVRIIQANPSGIVDIAAQPDGDDVATVHGDQTIQRWDQATLGAIGEPLTEFNGSPLGLRYADDSSLITRGATESTVWDLLDDGWRDALVVPLPNIEISTSGPPGHVLVIDETRHTAQKLDPVTGRGVGAPITVSSSIITAGLDEGTARYAYVVTGRDDGAAQVTISSIDTGERIASAELPAGLTVEKLSPDGHTMLLRPGAADWPSCCVVLWDMREGPEADQDVWPRDAFSGSFTPDGHDVLLVGQYEVGPATARRRTSIVARISLTGAEGARHRGQDLGTLDSATLVTGPDGLVAISGNSQIQLLRGPSLRPIGGPFLGDVVHEMAFSPDGSLLATASGTTVELWDVAAGESLGSLDVGSDVDHIAWAGGNHPALLTSADGKVSMWNVDPSDWATLACGLAGRQLTPDEWAAYMGETPYRPACSS